MACGGTPEGSERFGWLGAPSTGYWWWGRGRGGAWRRGCDGGWRRLRPIVDFHLATGDVAPLRARPPRAGSSTAAHLLFWVTHTIPIHFGREGITGPYVPLMLCSPIEYMVVKAEWLVVLLLHLPTRRRVLGQRHPDEANRRTTVATPASPAP